MWMLENHTPYAAERSWVQDKNGVQHWIVVVKATYDIRQDGSTELAETQEPPVRLGVHRGDPATSSLIYGCRHHRTKSGNRRFSWTEQPTRAPADRCSQSRSASESRTSQDASRHGRSSMADKRGPARR